MFLCSFFSSCVFITHFAGATRSGQRKGQDIPNQNRRTDRTPGPAPHPARPFITFNCKYPFCSCRHPLDRHTLVYEARWEVVKSELPPYPCNTYRREMPQTPAGNTSYGFKHPDIEAPAGSSAPARGKQLSQIGPRYCVSCHAPALRD